MKLINSVKKSRYEKIDTLFISDYKWEFLANKYSTIADEDIWEELEAEYMNGERTSVLYGDVDGHSCLDILQSAYNYKKIEQMFKYRQITLYTDKSKDFHILVEG